MYVKWITMFMTIICSQCDCKVMTTYLYINVYNMQTTFSFLKSVNAFLFVTSFPSYKINVYYDQLQTKLLLQTRKSFC